MLVNKTSSNSRKYNINNQKNNLNSTKKVIDLYSFSSAYKQPATLNFGNAQKTVLDWASKPRFKMKIAAVSRFQDHIKHLNEHEIAKDQPDLKLKFYKDKEEIGLIHPKTNKQLGYIDYDLLNYLYDDIKENPEDFTFKLCSKSKEFNGMKNYGLKAHVIYTNEHPEKLKKIKHKFEDIFEDKECQKVIFAPIKTEPPIEILKTILKFDKQIHGMEKTNEIEEAINNIAQEILNPKNKRILLLGHTSPDGDTIGCLSGMNNLIKMIDRRRKVDCVIDDRLPSLFSFVPDIKKIKLSSKEFKAKLINSQTENIDDKRIKRKLTRNIKRKRKTIPENRKYDLVIFMDVSSPNRFPTNLKNHIAEGQTKIIYIDHHAAQFNSWEKNKSKSGIDLSKSKEDKLYWVEDRVPAATQMVVALAGKISESIEKLSWLNDNNANNIPRKSKKLFGKFAKSIMTGMYTDTGSFSRSANLFEDDKKFSRWDRPNYKTKGLAKWFSEKTNNVITRNFIRRSLNEQDKKKKKHSFLIKSIVDKGVRKDNELGIGHIEVAKEDFNKLKLQMLKDDINYTETDIYGAFKYPYLGKLKAPYKGTNKDEIGNFNKDRLSNLAVQDSKGKIRFSFRSQSGTNHASLLGNLFGGGGHDSAAGGRISIPNIGFDTKLAIKINDKIVSSYQQVIKTLEENAKIARSASNESEKQKLTLKISIETNEEGETSNEIISNIVKEIRKKQKTNTANNRIPS